VGSVHSRRLTYYMGFNDIYELVIFILGAIFGGLFL
jgi:hypothetical protein